jgi:hypothetical protein
MERGEHFRRAETSHRSVIQAIEPSRKIGFLLSFTRGEDQDEGSLRLNTYGFRLLGAANMLKHELQHVAFAEEKALRASRRNGTVAFPLPSYFTPSCTA